MANRTGGNFYDAPDYYDTFWTENASALHDIPVYSGAFNRMLADRHPGADLIHLDICTGTGRVIHAVAKASLQAGLSLSNIKLIGVDISNQMLDEAAKLTGPDYAPVTTWVHGSAHDLLGSIPQLRGGKVKVDLVTSALSPLGELHGTSEPLQFLQGVSSVLRPHTGRMFLSFTDAMLMLGPKKFAAGDIVELPSKKNPNILYREVVDKYEVADGFAVYSATQLVFKKMGEEEEILNTKSINYKFRLHSMEELEELVAQAQMKILGRTRSGRAEQIFEIGLQ
jgi:hypothetical protein